MPFIPMYMRVFPIKLFTWCKQAAVFIKLIPLGCRQIVSKEDATHLPCHFSNLFLGRRQIPKVDKIVDKEPLQSCLNHGNKLF